MTPLICRVCRQHEPRKVESNGPGATQSRERCQHTNGLHHWAVRCAYCAEMAELVTGLTIYPHRPDLSAKQFWLCRPCKAWVGVHKGTINPLGRLANAELRLAKMAAHAAFDPLWKSGEMQRNEAYAWLARALGIPGEDCHIGEFDVELCYRTSDMAKAKRGLL